MNTKNTKTSAELKDDVRDDLIKVNQDLNNIKKRLTPGQIIDDVIYYPHGGNSKAVVQHLKDNPIGTSFLTLGTLLLMDDESHQSYEDIIRQKTGLSLEKLKEKYHNYEEVIKRDTGESLNSLKSRFQKAKAGMARTTELAKNLPPMSYVALGVGLGAVSGASLPIGNLEVIKSTGFNSELKTALNESASVFKSEFMNLVKEFDVNLFMSAS